MPGSRPADAARHAAARCVSISKRRSTYCAGAGSGPAASRSAPASSTTHLAEEIDVGDQVALAQAVLAEFDQHRLAAAHEAFIALLLEARRAVTRGDQRGIGEAAQRIVPAAGVGGDGAEDPSHVRVTHAAGGQVRGVLRLERVGHVVALERLLAAVEQRRDVGVVAAAPMSRSTTPRRRTPDQCAPPGISSSHNMHELPGARRCTTRSRRRRRVPGAHLARRIAPRSCAHRRARVCLVQLTPRDVR